jgi:predicted PurR-regulated permease PerM
VRRQGVNLALTVQIVMADHDRPTGTRGIEPASDPLTPTAGAPGEPAPVVVDAPVGVRNVPLAVLAVIASILLLQYASAVFIPVTIAILVSYALSPPVTSLQKRGVPPTLGAAVVLLLLLAALGLGVYKLSDQVVQMVESVPTAAHRLRERVADHRRQRGGVVEKVQRAATEVDKTAAVATPDTSSAVASANRIQQVEVVTPPFSLRSYLWSGSMTLLGFTGQFVLVLFLVYFFLVTGDLYKRKLVKIAGPTFTQKKLTVQILDEINRQIESFMRVQVLTSVLVAVATALALWWFGLEQYVVWGLLAGIFNSIPYLGPLIVTGGLGLVAFMQFDSIPKTIAVCGVAFLITSLEGFVLTPGLMSRASRINSAAIFTGLLFWSWIWGVWGTVLAVPMMMMIKAVCDHIEELQPIGELLGE